MLKDLLSSSRKELTQIMECFQLLDVHEKGVAKSIAQYILKGENLLVLETIKQLSQDQLSEAGVWSADYYQHNFPDKQQKKIEKIAKKFDGVYRSELLVDAEVFRRWGTVMALCMDFSAQNPHYKVDVPDWFAAVFLDMDSLHISWRNSYEIPASFDGKWLIHIAEEHDLSKKIWLSILLERINCWGYRTSFLDEIVSRTDWVSLLKQREVVELLDSLDLTGRVTLAKYLQGQDNLDVILSVIILLATDGSKQVREQAKLLLSKLSQSELQAYIELEFSSYSAARRKELAQLIAVYGDDDTVVFLEQLLLEETSKAVKEVIANTIANKQAAKNTKNTTFTIPEVVSLDADAPIPPHWLDLLKSQLAQQVEKARQNAEEEKERNKESKTDYHWQRTHYKELLKVTEKDLIGGLGYLASGKGKCHERVVGLISQSKVFNEQEFKLCHAIRAMKAENRNFINFDWGVFPQWLRGHPGELTDLRQLASSLEENGLEPRAVAQWVLSSRWESDFKLPDVSGMTIWPFFAENDDYLQEAFGLKESKEVGYSHFELAHGILVVEQFPVIPEQYLQVIYQRALSPAKTYGALARKTLTTYGLVEERVVAALCSSKQDERIIAANWIAELKLDIAIPDLQKALKKEKRETAKAALLGVLHKLDQDISSYLSPKVLLKEAQTGLKKAIPKSLSWFPFDSLPKLKWEDGKSVNNEIVKWWIVLGCKLKQPEGNPLLDLYLGRLEQASRKTLGLYILQVFIHQDTLCPSDDEASEYAKANQQSCYDNWLHWSQYEWAAEYKGKTLEDAYQALFREKKSEYLGSAISDKGILAMAGAASGGDSVEIISRYMKDHYTRRHQVEAMLAALASNDDPVVIQLLLSVARRHRTNSVQEKAKVLVASIAERNGWTHDELADRTIPTAGLEANGEQKLLLGSRELIVKLDADLKIVLQNEQGKTLKSMPAARQDDDPEQAKQAKKEFSSCKKELKQVIDLQGKRLYEAMCVGRQWSFSEWKEYLLEHPIMKHLVQKLVWEIEEGSKRYWVRPTPEMELIDLDDDDHEPSSDAKICVAHISQLPAGDGKAWSKNFKEEKIKPLFSQFDQSKHALTEDDASSNNLDYHKGWITDAFTLRGILTKRGYQRGDAEDGGFFTHYYKDFSALGVRVIIEFSGNVLPEENCAAVLYHVAFADSTSRGWISDSDYKPLASIHSNLVSEAMLDYEAVAAKGSFDSEWEKKPPW